MSSRDGSKRRSGDYDYGVLNTIAYGKDETAEQRETWKPQKGSYGTKALAGVGMALICLWLVDFAVHLDSIMSLGLYKLVDALKSTSEIMAVIFSTVSLVAGIAILITAIAIEMWDQTRVPPPLYRVRDELIQALIDSGILKPDMERMSSQIRVFPSSHYDSKNHCYSIEFELKSVRATQERMEKLQEGLASAFYKAQEVELEPSRDKRGNQVGWLLHVFYDVDPFSKTLKDGNPFDDDPLLAEMDKSKKRRLFGRR